MGDFLKVMATCLVIIGVGVAALLGVVDKVATARAEQAQLAVIQQQAQTIAQQAATIQAMQAHQSSDAFAWLAFIAIMGMLTFCAFGALVITFWFISQRQPVQQIPQPMQYPQIVEPQGIVWLVDHRQVQEEVYRGRSWR